MHAQGAGQADSHLLIQETWADGIESSLLTSVTGAVPQLFPPHVLFESAQCRPGDAEASEGHDVSTVKSIQHCIFPKLFIFNWSAMYLALAIS